MKFSIHHNQPRRRPIPLPGQRGFVILFTILISAIILMIGLGIFSVATRETVLSGTAREAQASFYAADAGVECALYAQSLPGGGPLIQGGSFDCGSTGGIANSVSVSSISPFEFYVTIGSGADATCAHVTVFEAGTQRHVISQGYNVCTAQGQPNTKNPLLVERDLDTTYEVGSASSGAAATTGSVGGANGLTGVGQVTGGPAGGTVLPTLGQSGSKAGARTTQSSSLGTGLTP